LNEELAKLIKSLQIPIILLVIMWLLMWAQDYFSFSLMFLGVFPLRLNGLQGVITSVFIHASWSHLASNTLPFFLFCAALYYYYPKVATKILISLWMLSGFLLWLSGRSDWHIGASGLIYALAFFHILTALLQREIRIMAFSMLIVFLYGSLFWGFFPEFFPNENISWEGHLMGAVAGIVFAFYYRNEAPKPKQYFADESSTEEDEETYWLNEH
jgi:membrane associated rhomboid family serine protease